MRVGRANRAEQGARLCRVVLSIGLVAATVALVPTRVAAEPPQAWGQQTFVGTGLGSPRDVAVDQWGNAYIADAAGGHWNIVKVPADGSPQVILGFTDLGHPLGVAVDRWGAVYASDYNHGRVLKLPPGGQQVELGFTGLIGPEGLAVDDAGNVFVIDSSHDELVELPADGGAQRRWAFASMTSLDHVTVDRWGNVYVSGYNNNVIEVLPADGSTATPITLPGSPSLWDIAFDDAGNSYVMMHDQVVKLPAGGGPQVVLPFHDLISLNGIDVDRMGNVYVADSSLNVVIKLPVGTGTNYPVGLNGLNFPYGVAVGANDDLYVTDQGHNRVLRVPSDGSSPVVLGFSGLNLPFGVAVNQAGDVFVADRGNDRVVKLPSGGGAQVTVGFSGLSGPGGVAVDASGSVYAADTNNHRVVKLPPSGPQVTLNFTGLNFPYGIALDTQGNVYASDYGNGRVVELTISNGQSAALDVPGLSFPGGIAVDATGNLFVADTGHDRVVEVPQGGQAITTLEFAGLNHPDGVALDSSGNAYVADSNNNRVVRLATAPPLLRVTTSPALPADIEVDGIQRDTWGLAWPQFSVGPHQVCFGHVPGFVAPPCQTVSTSRGSTSTVQGTYSQNGYLRVLTSPALPSTITVAGVARNDWGMWTEVPPGTYNVCFGAVAHFDAPACRPVTVSAGATATTTGTFTDHQAAAGPSDLFGYLRAVTDPPIDAMISVDGQPRDAWGLTWLKLPVGSHQICFGEAQDAAAPACQTVSITNGATATVTGSYVRRGFLRVITSPAVPANITVNGHTANAWGVWTDEATGLYQVCFGPVRGYVTPSCQTNVPVNVNGTTVTGTYTPIP